MAVGSALSVAGASLQALFKNPLVNEYILGISSGAAFGAALSLVFLGRSFPPQAAAFLFAILAVLAVLLVAGRGESSSLISLLLTGVIVSAFFSALLSLVEFFASPYVLQVDKLSFAGARVTSIVGPNGAGKTTLLKCLGAVLPVKKGTLFIDGKDIAWLKSHERVRLIGYVPQEHSSAFNYLVLDFVLMGRAAYVPLFSVPSKEDIRIAEEALDFVGLGSFADRTYAELSSGERRLVLIARALARQSNILLLDEPTTFLDPRHERQVLDLIQKLAVEKEKTILLTLHNLEMALQYSDDMVFMKKGGVVAWGKAGEVFQEPLLEDVYEMKMKVIDWNGRKIVLR